MLGMFVPLQESLEALVNCVVHRVGVVPGKPIAAVTIYKCFLRWKSFEADKTGVFDRVIQMIGSAFEVCHFIFLFFSRIHKELYSTENYILFF